MKRHQPRTLLAGLLLLLSIQTACALDVAEIGDEEYAVYNAALGNPDKAFATPTRCRTVFSETLTQHKLNADSIAALARDGTAPDLAIIEDFKHKNAHSYRLAKDRLAPPLRLADNWKPDFPSEGSVERLELSRVGFDAKREKALVVVSHTSRGKQRAFYSSGGYLLLEKQQGQWNVVSSSAGWVTHY